jgi:hypothetical protein
MAPPPKPPADCYEASSYQSGDGVYYLRMGTSGLVSFRGCSLKRLWADKWREGTCSGKAGSSDGSPLYNVGSQAGGIRWTKLTAD